MPRRKNLKNSESSLNYQNLILNRIRKNYLYLFLGSAVLLILLLLAIGYFFKKSPTTLTGKKIDNKVKQEIKKQTIKTYLVKEGDHLWKIAEEAYGSGYNAYDIAKANKLANPSLIHPGQTLILPEVQAKTPTKGQIADQKTTKVTFTGAKYLVKKGDHLWKIALEAYGDGYAWVKIAQANKLANPNLIFSGNELVIPRN